GSDQNAGRNATVPNPSNVKIATRTALECGRKNQAVRANAPVICGITKCQRRSPDRSELQPMINIPKNPAPNITGANQLTFATLQPVKRWSIVGSQNQNAYPPL